MLTALSLSKGTDEATGLSAIADRKALAKAEAYTITYERISEEEVRSPFDKLRVPSEVEG